MEPGRESSRSYRAKRGSTKVMTLDSASKTLTDGRTRHVDLLAFREDFDRDGLAGLELGSLLGIDTELFQSASSFDTSLSELAGESLLTRDGFFVPKATWTAV